MDPNNFVGPSGDGFDVYVNGVRIGHYADQASAESAFRTAKGGGTATTPGANTPTTPGVSAGAGAGAVAGATGGLVDPSAIKALMDLASQNAQQAYLNARLELERQSAGHAWTAQQEQLAQNAAHDAWSKTVAERGADVVQANATGYLGGVTNVSGKVNAAWNALPADQRTDARASAIWKAYVPGMSDQQAQAMQKWGRDVYLATGQQVTDEMVGQQLSSMGLGQGTPTLARQQFQAQTGQGLLDLAARLRGPDDAFAYARTLQNVPPEMRAQLDAMMRQQGISYGGPGLGTVAGQIVQGGLGGGTQQTQGGPMMQAQVMPQPYGGLQQAGPGGMLQSTPTAATPQQAPETDAAYQARAQQWAQGARAQGIPEAQIQQQLTQDAAARTGAVGGMPEAQQTQTSPTYMTYTGPGSPSAGGTTGPAATAQTSLGGATQQGGNAMTYQGASAGGQGVQHLYQLSPQQLNNTNEYVKRLMMAGYDDPGSGTSALGEQSAYQMSLPKYSGPRSATVRV
jgi:hypothetical protein